MSYATVHKDGSVSVDLARWLMSDKGRETLERVALMRFSLSRVAPCNAMTESTRDKPRG